MGYGQPACAEGYVVLPGGRYSDAAFNGLLAFQADSGGVAWMFAAAEPAYPTPAIADSVVYFGSEDGALYAVDLESGLERWSAQVGAAVLQGPAIHDGVVYVAGANSVLGAYDARSGQELWSVTVAGSDLGGIAVTPTEAGDALILVGDGTGTLHAFDELGAEVYTVKVTDAPIFMPPTVVNGVIYVSASDGTVYALTA
jgi:outer membrane protein assembly factor BamB